MESRTRRDLEDLREHYPAFTWQADGDGRYTTKGAPCIRIYAEFRPYVVYIVDTNERGIDPVSAKSETSIIDAVSAALGAYQKALNTLEPAPAVSLGEPPPVSDESTVYLPPSQEARLQQALHQARTTLELSRAAWLRDNSEE